MELHVRRLIDHVHPRVADLEASRAFYRAVLGALCGDGYPGAFVLDPDGNNIEAARHGPAVRSAPSVTLRPE